jgi:hypothetical protein
VVAILVVSGLYTAVAVADSNRSRTEATDWLSDNLDGAATVDVYSQRVYLPEFPESVTVNRYVIHSSYNRSEWQPGLERLDCRAPEYIVLSSDHYFRFFKDPTVFPTVTEHLSELIRGERGYEIVERFGPPITTDHSAGAKFSASLSTVDYPADGNPTIVVLRRTTPPEQC